MNPNDGVILVEATFGPKDPLTDPAKPLPATMPLRRLSDFMFLAFQDACNGEAEKIRKLNWVIIHDITNNDCELLWDEVQELEGARLTSWPGTTLLTTSDSGKALLGCASGLGTPWMLAEHRIAFGAKTVDRVVVFADDGKDLSFAFSVKDLKATASKFG